MARPMPREPPVMMARWERRRGVGGCMLWCGVGVVRCAVVWWGGLLLELARIESAGNLGLGTSGAKVFAILPNWDYSRNGDFVDCVWFASPFAYASI